jgi:hypothetical protein
MHCAFPICLYLVLIHTRKIRTQRYGMFTNTGL